MSIFVGLIKHDRNCEVVVLGGSHCNGQSDCYGKTVPDMFHRIICISVLPSFYGNTVTH